MLTCASVALTLIITAQGAQAPPRDPRPVAQPAPQAENPDASLERMIAASPSNAALYISLSKAQEQRGAFAEAEATLKRARETAASKKSVLGALAGFYNRRGDFERSITTLEEAAALDPSDPTGYQAIATYYWEKAQKDKQLAPAQRWTYIFEGINATDRALALKSDYVEALTYKSILLRMRASMETDPVQQKATLAEADALRASALASNKTGAGVASGAAMISSTGGPVPPPPPAPPSTQAPLRVGGNIRAPAKLRHVAAVYPPEAQQAKISGVVIIEATIGPDGLVYEAKVLKSIPLLDQAAIDSVRQWEFEPTLLNGAPVPVIMTVTVNFALM